PWGSRARSRLASLGSPRSSSLFLLLDARYTSIVPQGDSSENHRYDVGSFYLLARRNSRVGLARNISDWHNLRHRAEFLACPLARPSNSRSVQRGYPRAYHHRDIPCLRRHPISFDCVLPRNCCVSLFRGEYLSHCDGDCFNRKEVAQSGM